VNGLCGARSSRAFALGVGVEPLSQLRQLVGEGFFVRLRFESDFAIVKDVETERPGGVDVVETVRDVVENDRQFKGGAVNKTERNGLSVLQRLGLVAIAPNFASRPLISGVSLGNVNHHKGGRVFEVAAQSVKLFDLSDERLSRAAARNDDQRFVGGKVGQFHRAQIGQGAQNNVGRRVTNLQWAVARAVEFSVQR